MNLKFSEKIPEKKQKFHFIFLLQKSCFLRVMVLYETTFQPWWIG